MPEFYLNDLVNLPKYNIYLKLMIDGVSSRPFSAATLPPFEKQKESFAEKIIKNSRERHSTPKVKIEEKIARWSGVLETKKIIEKERKGFREERRHFNPMQKVTPFSLKDISGKRTFDASSRNPKQSKENTKQKPDTNEVRKVIKEAMRKNNL